ncbi:hypothetical protein WJX84_011265 [Apatococcus fuscideae]|uniref:Uncharacterized protein n=1 Tax=Apatococcus fuscideae TaxID=2026836 RepID=A0AAW1T8R4_9CHLO
MVRALVASLPPPPGGLSPRGPRSSRFRQKAASGSSPTSSSAKASLSQGIVRSALTCGAISTIGDILAQAVTRRQPGSDIISEDHVENARATDLKRTARMGIYGTIFYGPFQHIWYGLLDRIWPTKQFNHFLCKLLANQFALGPITLVTSFAWTYTLLNKQDQLAGKLRRDGLPTLQNGWKFWIPAASLNFLLIPLRLRVLFMSLCGVCWTGYLSNQSNAG